MTVNGETVKPKNWKKRIFWISILMIFSIWFIVTYQYIGEIESNSPHIVFKANSYEQRILRPYADKKDPNILYLAFVGEDGNSVRVDLKTKTITPFRFNVVKWEEIRNLAIEYNQGSSRRCFEQPPISWELRGRKISHSVFHLFGFPYPSDVGTYQGEFRFGYWYIVDKREERKVGLLRVRVWNSELNGSGIGSDYISPDGKWAVFQVGGVSPWVYIFDRTASGPEVFK